MINTHTFQWVTNHNHLHVFKIQRNRIKEQCLNDIQIAINLMLIAK